MVYSYKDQQLFIWKIFFPVWKSQLNLLTMWKDKLDINRCVFIECQLFWLRLKLTEILNLISLSYLHVQALEIGNMLEYRRNIVKRAYVTKKYGTKVNTTLFKYKRYKSSSGNVYMWTIQYMYGTFEFIVALG